nr:hypothetical protein [Tanacetum cinerariifolium]
MRENKRKKSDNEGVNAGSPRLSVVTSDIAANNNDSLIIHQKDITLGEIVANANTSSSFIHQKDIDYGEGESSKLEGKSHRGFTSGHGNIAPNEQDYWYEDEDFAIFGQLFKSIDTIRESADFTSERSGQKPILRRSSKKANLSIKLSDYVLDDKMDFSIDRHVNLRKKAMFFLLV